MRQLLAVVQMTSVTGNSEVRCLQENEVILLISDAFDLICDDGFFLSLALMC